MFFFLFNDLPFRQILLLCAEIDADPDEPLSVAPNFVMR